MAVAQGPLTGLRVVELAGLAPAPFCGQLLSSNGASVIRVDRPPQGGAENADILTSYKSSITLDLKLPACTRLLRRLLERADVLVDPYRPGVLERLELNPDVLSKVNPRLIIVRITGFRRDGLYKDMAGHDINYLAVSGVLSMLGPKGQPPSPPANLLADYAGGGLVAFAGVLLALLQRAASGKGQVVEASMVDGASYVGTIPRLRLKEPVWDAERGTNLLDGGCPYYRCYECKDAGNYVSVGALERPFFAQLLEGLGLSMEDVVPKGLRREDKRAWSHIESVFEACFKQKTRKEWEQVFLGTDACVAPVLRNEELEAAGYPQRPMVHLTESPSLPVVSPWEGHRLREGDGGQDVLDEWMSWKEGEDYTIQNNVFVALDTYSKL